MQHKGGSTEHERLHCHSKCHALYNFHFQGLAKYTDLFLRQEIDLRTFATLSEDDLKEVGVQTFGARKKLMMLATSEEAFSFNARNELWQNVPP